MKKFSTLLLMGCLVITGNLNAQNESKENEFTISTQIRPRAEYRNGALSPRLENESSAGFINNRARISMEYKRSDLIVKFSAQHVGVWGQDPQIDKNGRFALNEAWAGMNFGKGFFGIAGRQALAYDDERILGALDWNVAGRYHDALKLGYENQNHKLHLILSFHQNDEQTDNTYYNPPTPIDFKSMQTLWYNVSATGIPLNASFLLMNIGNEKKVPEGEASTGKTKYMQTFGTYITYSPGDFVLNGTFYYQTGKSAANIDINAYMFALRAQYNITNEWSAMLASDYLSGNKSGDSKIKAFNPLYGTHHKFYGTMDYFYATGLTATYNPGLWDNQAGVTYKPCNAVALNLNYHYFLTAQEYDNYKKGLGSEVDLQVDWSIKKDIKLSAGYSFMKGTKTMDQIKGGDHKSWQDWGWVSLNINPRVLFVKW
jgi:hypothetical protein